MNISFDLETLGNTHNAPIVQIGACKFENNGNITSTFSRTVIIEDLDNYNLTPDYSTINWWLKQDSEAIEQVFGEYSIKYSLKHALEDFKKWVGNDEFNIWSHASFDPPVLKNNLKAVGIEPFIHYRLFKDLRTLKELAGNPEVKREGKHHVAIDDAIYQAELISKCFKILNYSDRVSSAF
ncbi:3'-5' exoribonuclease [Polaribacter sp. MSW13]|uniref:3'-5' exoribonuclease n=1 Tax=Polaribacter marinus TaxID=2916838 RepID=A0A9X1VSV4_9FLAO|nr:3'-5' exonuclease [Polaribacter marinus]MCI2230407.1 3'-5' exoribonuclease [Polaribacter marinus]